MERLAENVRPARAAAAERGSGWCSAIAAFVPESCYASEQCNSCGDDKPKWHGHQSACRQYYSGYDFTKRWNKCRGDTGHCTDELDAAVFHDSSGSGCSGAEHGGQSTGSGLVWDVDGPDFAHGKSRDLENDALCSSHSLVCYSILFKHGDGAFYGAVHFQRVLDSADLLVGLVAPCDRCCQHDAGIDQRYRLYRVVAKKTAFIISRVC